VFQCCSELPADILFIFPFRFYIACTFSKVGGWPFSIYIWWVPCTGR
jgi:hypothetical protein